MAEKTISTKISIRVNLILLVLLIAGGATVLLMQKRHMDQLIDMEVAALENEFFQRGSILSQVGARAIGQIIDEAIDNTSFEVKDFFNYQYEEIPGFEPPKYHYPNGVDSYLDKAILSVEDEFLKDKDIAYAVAVDVKGYVPTHNSKFQQPPTGDKEKDKLGNRTKQIFNDEIGLKAANTSERGFRQVYHRNTGETMWDFSSPIMVKGKQWGGFRVGLSIETVQKANDQFREKTQAARLNFQMTLAAVLLLVLVASLLTVYLAIKKAMEPLRRMTRIANQLADGKIDQPIQQESDDELGQLAEVLERLRVSLKKSIERLSRKT